MIDAWQEREVHGPDTPKNRPLRATIAGGMIGPCGNNSTGDQDPTGMKTTRG